MSQEAQVAQNEFASAEGVPGGQAPLAGPWGDKVYCPIPPDKLAEARFNGVDAHLKHVLGPQRVQLIHLESWAKKTLRPYDAVVLEMTTNAFQLYDDLLPYAYSVTLVHPPHISLITRAQVMTDKIAARVLAQLHAVGLLPPVWVPPQAVRDQRALAAQRTKLTRLATQAKNRLHAVLHRHHLPPAEGDLFAAAQRDWWLALPVTPLERVRIQSDLDTLAFAQTQLGLFENVLTDLAVQDERVLRLIPIPGIGLITATALLAAIGDVSRFPDAEHLVGYAGLGARVHDSGLTCRTGKITKAGRRDIRAAMVEAAHVASNTHPHWQAELARLEPRLGHNKAIVAIARKLLVTVWHVLAEGCVDRFADSPMVARKLLAHAERLGKAHRPNGQPIAAYVRDQLDRLGLGGDLESIQRGKRTIKLPPSSLSRSAH
jgi:transposase